MANTAEHRRTYTGRTAVVDSDTDAAERLVVSLANEGFRVDRICSVGDMLRLLCKQQYDALILGTETHGLKCYELLPLIREIDDQLPVIVVSSDDSFNVAARVREQGVFYYMLKPLDISELKIVLKNALQKRSLWFRAKGRSIDHRKGRI